ncbi:alpha-hydroxy acid oxidase [Rugosimonospora acidiphila]|uniref:Alpha-hydroxy acid oxidase n=1 Tax=Rugosimonospora acidiphila TaxID=556531 RepID=A0ABP9RV95_9ACTN
MLNLREFEAAAASTVDRVHYDYLAGGAWDEVTLRDNEAAFGRLRLLPRVLRGRDKPELDVSLFGCHAASPVLMSPTAFHRLVHPEGERATARAAAATGTIMVASMAATVAIADIAAAAREAAGGVVGGVVGGGDPALWFQLYIQPDLEVTEALVARATAAGARALVVTVDSPVFGAHERDRRNGFLDLPAGMACENMRGLPGGEPDAVRPIAMSPEICWDHLDWLRQATSLPVVLKGILHPEDARLALRHGVDGLMLSNHGGRQLDTVPATIDLLPEIVAAVGGRMPVILDGGVRRGTDVVKALALGASAVGIGRPVLWGLAADGERGVRRVLELLREEVDAALALCGAGSPRDLTPDLVRRRS